MILRFPPQCWHECKSKPKTRARSSAHRLARAGRWGIVVGESAGSAVETSKKTRLMNPGGWNERGKFFDKFKTRK